MKVVFHQDFNQVYTTDPAAAHGRIEAVMRVIEPHVELVTAKPARERDIASVHSETHVEDIKRQGLYPISALAAGGAMQAATIGLTEPCFGLLRPPGHHASRGSCWGFCFFNNMAVAIEHLKQTGRIDTAYVLDIDLHFGDGTDNILGGRDYVKVYNVESRTREAYLDEVAGEMDMCRVDVIGISAGFDNHREDWGGVLTTADYFRIGQMVRKAADRAEGGCFALLEGGYNHEVLGKNTLALINGLSGKDGPS